MKIMSEIIGTYLAHIQNEQGKVFMMFLALLISMMSLSVTAAEEFHIPKEVSMIMNKKLASHGPNCWGTALYLKGVSKRPRFVSDAEIKYWQESSLCRPLEITDQILPGDIMNVYGPEYVFETDFKLDEQQKFINFFEPDRYKEINKTSYSGFHRLLHSETFVNKNQVFGKESPNKDDAFKLTKINEVYGRPRDLSECQESPTLTPHLRQFDNLPRGVKGSKCSYFTKVFRCQNFSTLPLNQEDKALMEQVFKHQNRIFEAVVSKSKALSKAEKKVIREFANTHLQEIKLQVSSVHNEETRMVLSWKFFSVYALIEGITWLETV